MFEQIDLTVLSEAGSFPTEAVSIVVLFAALGVTAAWLYYLYQ